MKCSHERASLYDAVHFRSVNPSAEDEHTPCLRPHHKVSFVDRAFHSAGLVWALEVTFDLGAILL